MYLLMLHQKLIALFELPTYFYFKYRTDMESFEVIESHFKRLGYKLDVSDITAIYAFLALRIIICMGEQM